MLYAGTQTGGVFKTADGGNNWSKAFSGGILTLAIDPSDPQTLYAGTLNGGVFKTTDGGGSWSAVNSGLPDSNVRSLAVDPRPRLASWWWFGLCYKQGHMEPVIALEPFWRRCSQLMMKNNEVSLMRVIQEKGDTEQQAFAIQYNKDARLYTLENTILKRRKR